MGLLLSDLIISTTVFVIVTYFLRVFSKKNESIGSLKQPPSLSIFPLLRVIISGGMAALPMYFMKCSEELGPVLSFKIGKVQGLVLNGYDAINDALVKHSEAFADRFNLWLETKINPDLRGIIFGRYSEKWKKYHKVSLSILKEFGYGVRGVTEARILDQAETMIQKIEMLNGKPFYPKEVFTHASAEVIVIILFGKEFVSIYEDEVDKILENSNKIVLNMDNTINLVPFIRFLPTFRKKVIAQRQSSDALRKSIEKAIRFNIEKSTDMSFVKSFLEIQGPNYDHEELIFILRDLIFASTETVATALQWAMIALANHPEIQSKLQCEIDSVVSRDRLPSLEEQPHLPYTQAFVLELFRRYSGFPFLSPHCTSKDTSTLGYFVPKGCLVLANINSAHLNGNVWKDAENFIPERFLDKDYNVINSDKILTFGLGKRLCIGELLGRQQTFLLLVSIAQNFDCRPPENQDMIVAKAIVGQAMSPSPFEVRLIPRAKAC